MAKHITRAALLTQMRAHFPDRWEVAHMDTRFEGEKVIGAVKIHCIQDDKVFLSDFSAKLDKKGRISDLTLDGVHVGKFIGRMHQP
jgi:hypothetical protein